MPPIASEAYRRRACGAHRLWLVALLVALPWSGAQATQPPVVRVAMVGGIELSGVWPKLAQHAGTALGLRIETVTAAPKESVLPAFKRGDADLLLIHGGDETFALQASGHAQPLRVWAWNEHVVVGPDADPAGVREARDAEDAMRRIVTAGAAFIAFRDPGSHTIVQRLLRSSGIRPDAVWLHLDTASRPQAILSEAARLGAYVVVGHIPAAFGKMSAPGVRVLFKGDPRMRRAYVVVTPGERHPASVQARANAERLADYLLSPTGQSALEDADAAADGPWLFPLNQVVEP